MRKRNQTQKKINSTLIGVFLVFSVFSQKNSTSFFIQAGTEVVGSENVHIVALTKKTTQNIFYVKEKTVFYAGKNEAVKIVYVSNTKKIEKNEKLITTFHKEKLHSQKIKQLQLQFKPISKRPFKFSYLGFYSNNYLAIVVPNILQSTKTNTLFKHKISTTICHAVSISDNTSSVTTSNNFSYKTSKYNLRILETNFGRPPPFV